MHRSLIIVAGALALATPARGQAPRIDPRLAALLGCWVLAPDALARAGGAADAEFPLCIVPGPSPTQVRLMTMDDGDVFADGELLDIAGRPSLLRRGVCRGQRIADASPAATRLTVSDELVCAGRTSVRIVTVLDLVTPTRLVEARGWRDMGAARQAYLVEREPLGDSASLPAAVQVALADQLRAIEAARANPIPAVTGSDIIAVTTGATPAVARGWLLGHARQRRFAVTVDVLRALRLADIPGEVTDMIVAGAFPEAFTVTERTELTLKPPPVRTMNLVANGWTLSVPVRDVSASMGWSCSVFANVDRCGMGFRGSGGFSGISPEMSLSWDGSSYDGWAWVGGPFSTGAGSSGASSSGVAVPKP